MTKQKPTPGADQKPTPGADQKTTPGADQQVQQPKEFEDASDFCDFGYVLVRSVDSGAPPVSMPKKLVVPPRD